MDKKQLTAAIFTLGCKVNLYESEAIAESLSSMGISIKDFDDVCDIYIINTCTVTADSDRKGLKTIRRAIKKNPDAFVAVTGCLAQRKPESIARIPGVSLITGNEDKISVAKQILDNYNEKYVGKFEISITYVKTHDHGSVSFAENSVYISAATKQ